MNETLRTQVLRALAAAMAVLACLRCATMIAPFPAWDLSPFEAFVPIVGITPDQGLLLDAVLVLLAGIGFGLAPKTRQDLILAALWTLGAASAVVHMWRGGGVEVDAARIGGSWIAATGAGLSLSVLARERGARALATGVLIGFLAMMVFRGVVQVFVEHALTLSMYDADPEGQLRAQGFEPGSAPALIYERRLRQAEATGWFGLSNVYGSLCAAGLVGCAIALVTMLRRDDRDSEEWQTVQPRSWTIAALSAIAGLSLLGLVLSGSKGAYVSAVLGLVFAFVYTAVRLRIPLLPIAAALALVAVAVRGVVGDGVGELSLLFRWHYITTAWQVFLENPLRGVGPDGFQDAYVGAKPSINPEEVQSPHSVGLDWLATLGLGGAAWCVAGLLVLLKSRGAEEEPAGDSTHEPLEGWGRPVALLIAVATVAATSTELEALLPESAAVRVLGGAAWVFTAAVIARAGGLPAAALLGAAVVVVAHAQIEMTLTTEGSAAWLLCLLGLVAGGLTKSPAAQPSSRAAAALSSLPLVASSALLALLALGPVGTWSRTLQSSALNASTLSEGGNPVAIADQLSLAAGLAPAHVPTARTAGTLRMLLNDPETALEIGQRLTEARPDSARAWAVAGSLRAGAANAAGSREEAERGVRSSIEALERASRLHPSSVVLHRRIAAEALRIGDRELARRSANSALEANAQLGLDPLKQAGPYERAWLEAVAAGRWDELPPLRSPQAP